MIEFADRSFLYGDGLFETIRVTERGAEFLDRHIFRFRKSAAYFDFTSTQTDAAVFEMNKLETAEPGLWRVTISRDTANYPMGGTCSIQVHRREVPKSKPPRLLSIRGFYFPGDLLAEHKTTSYLRNVEARRRAQLLGADDALMVSLDGSVGEASMANVFAVVNRVLVTPPVDGILPGIVRDALIRTARERSIQVVERPMSLDQLLTADEVMITSSGVGVLAVKAIDDRTFGTRLAENLNVWLYG